MDTNYILSILLLSLKFEIWRKLIIMELIIIKMY